MAIPEDQLSIWANQGAITTSKTTYDQIKAILKSEHSPYSDKNFDVFLQGSYRNDTNVYLESDVDIIIQLSAFHYNLNEIPIEQKAAFSQVFNGGVPYDLPDFKRDVLAHLQERFPGYIVQGEKAINILADGNRRSADIIVCLGYRNYKYFYSVGQQDYYPGIWFRDSDGINIINYPKLHSENLTAKHQGTNSWLKPTIRIFKNMRNKMIADGIFEDGNAPSYFVEGMLWNVPNDKFGISYRHTVANALNWLCTADRSNFLCANEQYKLLHSDSSVTWRAEKCTAFLDAACDLWNHW